MVGVKQFSESFLNMKKILPALFHGKYGASLYYLLHALWIRNVLLPLPLEMAIEPANVCNLCCPLCPTGSGKLNRPPRLMSFDEYRGIIDQVKSYCVDLYLYNYGEPFLNPELTKMIDYAVKAGIFVRISTNGEHFSSKELCSDVVKSGLQRLIVSLDGVDQETLSKYRKNANLSRVVAGIRNIMEAKQRKSSKTPLVELQFIIMKHNEHQSDAMHKLADELGVDVYAEKTAFMYRHPGDADFQSIAREFIPENLSHSRYQMTSTGDLTLKGSLVSGCSRIFQSMTINSDGTAVPCCYDLYSDYMMGNVFNEKVRSIWKNEKYRNFRRHVTRNRHQVPMCTSCPENRHDCWDNKYFKE